MGKTAKLLKKAADKILKEMDRLDAARKKYDKIRNELISLEMWEDTCDELGLDHFHSSRDVC